jgi:drug/metabolite transporter (DMT)-like permease
MKRWPVDLPTTSFTGWQMLIALVPVLSGAFFFENGSFSPLGLTAWPLWGLIYNAIVSSIFCNWAWIKIATHAPISVSSLSTLMIPIVGVFSGMLVLGERPQWSDFAALALVVAALAVVLMPQRQAA